MLFQAEGGIFIQLSAVCLKLCANLGTAAPSTAASLANSHIYARGCKPDERKCQIQEKLLLATDGEHRTSDAQFQGHGVKKPFEGCAHVCFKRHSKGDILFSLNRFMRT